MSHQNPATLQTLRDWLGSRGASERATLARLWALPESASSSGATLAEAMLDPQAVGRVVAALGLRERAALTLVQQYGGEIAAPVLEREFGGLRSINNYVNPRAYLLALEQPPSPTERLWAMGLLQSESDCPGGCYRIPADLLPLLPPAPERQRHLQLAPAAEPQHVVLGDPRGLEQRILDLLKLAQENQLEVLPSGKLNKASLARLASIWKLENQLSRSSREQHWPYIQFVRQLAEAAGLLRQGADNCLRPAQAVLDWLQQSAPERARRLLEGWVMSSWDELASLLQVSVQRSYFRDLAGAKRAALRLIGQVPAGEWISLDDFVAQVKLIEPDFARRDGRYDTWGLIGSARQPLDGFAHWQQIEGQQLKAIASCSLHWLGLTDCGIVGERVKSVRLSALGAALLAGAETPAEPPPEPLVIQPNFEVLAPAYASLYARFQLGRIAEYRGGQASAIYSLTKRSIQAALNRGIALEDAIRFLSEHSAHELPRNVVASLREWAGQYGQVALRRGVLLEASDPLLLEQIKRDKRVRMPSFEQLTEHTWLLREGDVPDLAQRLRKAGYGLAGDGDSPQAPLREHDLAVVFAALEFYSQSCAELGIESGTSAALRKRVARLIPERSLHRAFQTSRAALRALKDRLEENTR